MTGQELVNPGQVVGGHARLLTHGDDFPLPPERGGGYGHDNSLDLMAVNQFGDLGAGPQHRQALDVRANFGRIIVHKGHRLHIQLRVGPHLADHHRAGLAGSHH